ncbi:11777_t:CDS:2 [Funneliformis mosseae]|uniref:11777_t:CDS:1 n=1 Tax=Funneliformis mosseae TaxID=27381 RepID=A0A9N8WKP4_FUNMO|nr:11777_t:CDS:2 [Funneliformis mosseae]
MNTIVKKDEIPDVKAQLDDECCDKSDEETDFVCTAIPNPEPLQGKLLLEPVKKLSEKSPKDWNDDDVMPIVKLLAGRTCIDGSGDNFEGTNAFHSIIVDF